MIKLLRFNAILFFLISLIFSNVSLAADLSEVERQKLDQLLTQNNWDSEASPYEATYHHSFRKVDGDMLLILTKKGKDPYPERPLEVIPKGYQLKYSKGVIRYMLSGDFVQRQVRDNSAKYMKRVDK